MEGGDNPIVFTMTKPAPAPSPATVPDPLEGTSSSSLNEDEKKAPQTDYVSNDDLFADTSVNAIPQETVEQPPPPAVFEEGSISGAFAVQEEAYERYISMLERDAIEENKLNKLREQMIEEVSARQVL